MDIGIFMMEGGEGGGGEREGEGEGGRRGRGGAALAVVDGERRKKRINKKKRELLRAKGERCDTPQPDSRASERRHLLMKHAKEALMKAPGCWVRLIPAEALLWLQLKAAAGSSLPPRQIRNGTCTPLSFSP